MQHSKGPFRTGPINYADIYDSEGELIALLIKGNDTTEGNAALFVAAPDLEALAIECRDHLYSHQDMLRVRDMAKQALRKVEGQ